MPVPSFVFIVLVITSFIVLQLSIVSTSLHFVASLSLHLPFLAFT